MEGWLERQYDFSTLDNEAETLVIRELERQLTLPENEDVCRDEECILDMAAYALNHVTPLYRATLLGRLYASALDQEHAEEVRKAVTEAIEQVRNNPPSTAE
jgi:competence protein ComFB